MCGDGPEAIPIDQNQYAFGYNAEHQEGGIFWLTRRLPQLQFCCSLLQFLSILDTRGRSNCNGNSAAEARACLARARGCSACFVMRDMTSCNMSHENGRAIDCQREERTAPRGRTSIGGTTDGRHPPPACGARDAPKEVGKVMRLAGALAEELTPVVRNHGRAALQYLTV
jgi:hypothetical protein